MAVNVSIHNTIPKGGTPTISKENENFFRLELLLIEIGRKSLYHVFQNHYKGSLDIYLKSYKKKLEDLCYKRNVINSVQWGLIFPMAKIDQWDISLFCILLRSICCLPRPKAGWGKKPDVTDQSISADIERLRCLRNECQGHIPKAALTDVEFSILWKDIETVILRLSSNTLKSEVDAISTASFERSLYQRLLESTQQWNQQEVMFSVYILTEYADNLKELPTSNFEQIKLVENTLSKFENGVTKQLLKIQDKNCTVEKMVEKVTNICNETLGSMVKIISNDKKHEELILNLQDIVCSLEMVQTSLEMHKDIVALQKKTFKILEDQGDILKLNYGLAKSTDSKMDHLIHCAENFFSGCCHGDLSEDEESKDYTFDRESSKYGNGNKTEKQNGNAIDVTCECGYRYSNSYLRKYCEVLIEGGKSNLFCKNCHTVWEYTQVRDVVRWSDLDREKVERKLSQNFINNDKEIKHCPSCKRFCVRKNPNDVRIICLFCSFENKRFEFCWKCLREWKSSGIIHCGNIGCIHEPTNVDIQQNPTGVVLNGNSVSAHVPTDFTYQKNSSRYTEGVYEPYGDNVTKPLLPVRNTGVPELTCVNNQRIRS